MQGQDITFMANGVEDRYGQVNSVAFYLDAVDTGHLLGVDESSAGGWTLTTTVQDLSPSVTWGGGAHTYYAVVTDNYGATAQASRRGPRELAPAVGDLTTDHDPVTQGTQLILTLDDVQDPDGDDIVDAQFYRDSNGNGSFDVGVDQLISNFVGGNVQYPSGNPDGSGDYTWTGLANFPEGQQIYFARARDSQGAWSDVAIGSGRVQNAVPTIGALAPQPRPGHPGLQPDPDRPDRQRPERHHHQGGVLPRLRCATAASTPPGTMLLGTISFSATSDYALTVPVSWAAGSQLYFARAQDNEGAWSNAALARAASMPGPPSASSPPTPRPTCPMTRSTISP